MVIRLKCESSFLYRYRIDIEIVSNCVDLVITHTKRRREFEREDDYRGEIHVTYGLVVLSQFRLALVSCWARQSEAVIVGNLETRVDI